jgi:LAT3 family solute carrier family 43 protein 3
VGSIGFQLESKGDADGFFTALFSILYASAALLAPFGGYLADVLGLAVTQAVATLLVAASLFVLASPAPLNVQSVGLATYSVGRMLTFGMYFSNVGKRFGYANYGFLAGLGLLISAIASLVQFPLIALAANGEARKVNLSCGAALIATLPYCLWLGWKERNTKAPVDEEMEIEQNEGDEVIEHTSTNDPDDSGDVRNNEVGSSQQQEGQNPRGRPRDRRMTFMGSFLRQPSYFGL